ncbi:MAG TPA: hypothetical protein VJP79_06075 [Nitrososphaera sp.]|nr:hypothetical protein [Nitrososphaera sp.]
MGLTTADRKELESLIKAAANDPKVPVGIARRMVPNQGDIEDFAYGLSSGMVIGNFSALFRSRNGRELDRDEIADLFSVLMTKMPRIRQSIKKHLDMR